MPEDKKDEILLAVYQAIGIAGEKMKSPIWTETWKVTKHSTTHTMTRINNSLRNMRIGVSLMVGSSHQRRAKRFTRKNDVISRSFLIAQQTGADFREIIPLYFSLMDQYIDDSL